MTLSKQQAIVLVNARINEMDLDWPTKAKHAVVDELTQSTDTGWLFFYGVVDEVRVAGRDPEPQDNPPCLVNRETGELTMREGVQ